ncbi:uncharacterized protein LOC100891423 isoform X2 [Strongylocentrotus purpuratus]|uniref:EF-hand domain-containing protein n=1 Tax=Strongylocentrotus purpuratus TaxID=7668 RepID=A0A7M7P7I9_STRPU|nr:uncharacterized protein LOC100891423 isoform X2 [Strongylocentrotus purpuratus]
MKGHSGDVMTSDPNKQTFPLITGANGGATLPSLPDDTLPSPSKEMESLSSNSKASIELPRLLQPREELAPPSGRDNDKALKPSLPLVRRSRYKRSGTPPDPDRDQLASRFNVKDSLPYQACNFRSSTLMKSVSIQKKKDQSPLAIKSIPFPLSKQRAVPIHTQPFLWSQVEESDKPQEGQSLPEKFLAEKERLFNVRGQKRRMAHPLHRQKYSDLHIGGHSHGLSNKLDWREEYDKVKNAVLPTEAQELFLGRGLTFPSSHGTNVRKQKWQERIKQEAALPSSAPPSVSNYKASPPAKDAAPRKQSITAPPVARQRTERDVDPQHVPFTVHRTPVKPKANRRDLRQDDSGVSTADGSTVRGSRASGGQRSQCGHGGGQRVERVKKVGSREEIVDVPVVTESAEDRTEERMETEERLQEEPVDALEDITLDQPDDATNDISLPRPDSEMDIDEPLEDSGPVGPVLEQPYTPKPPSPNPLMSADLHLNMSDEKRDALALKFTKLDSDKDGHITFKELETTFPENLSRPQQRYIKEAYELVSASTFFGLEEFVTISCLCERLAKLTGPVRDAFEKVNQSMLQQNITQFVVMFSTVDRQQTGCISLASFQELLGALLNKDLASDTRLFSDILSTIGKNGSLSIDKVEYLVLIPFFLGFK